MELHKVAVVAAAVVMVGTAMTWAGAYKITDPGYWPVTPITATGTMTYNGGGSASTMADGDVGNCTGFAGGSVPWVWYDRFASAVTINQARLYHMYGRAFDTWELAYDSDPTAGETFVPLFTGTGSDYGRMSNLKGFSLTTQALRLTVNPGVNIDPRGRELELYSATSGAPMDIINAAVTATAQSSAAKGNAAILIDGFIDGSAGWQPGTIASSTPEWAYFLFPDVRPINGVRAMAEAGTLPSSIDLQYLRVGGDPATSTDWLSYGSVGGLASNWGTVWFHENALTYFHTRGLRLYMNGNTNGGGWFRLGEIEIYGLPEPTAALLLLTGAALVLRRARR